MANLTSFVICSGIQNVPINGTLVPQLTGPLVAVLPKYIPGNFSFGVGFGLQNVDFTIENTLQIIIKSPKGDVVQDLGEVVLQKQEELHKNLPKEYKGWFMTVDLRNLNIETAGEYKFIIILNGELIEERIIPIYKDDDAK